MYMLYINKRRHLLRVDGSSALQQQRRLGKVDPRSPAVERNVELGEFFDVVLKIPARAHIHFQPVQWHYKNQICRRQNPEDF